MFDPLYRLLVRPLLFQLDPEKAHDLTIEILKHCAPLAEPIYGTDRSPIKVGGIVWNHPIGVAAGFDKNGECLPFLSEVFGAVEMGTVTPKPQPGNERPRLFRYPDKRALRNFLGFNNRGALAAKANLVQFRRKKKEAVVGVNIGKNLTTPLERAIDDYRSLYYEFFNLASYLVVNISSPNTQGLRSLQNENFIKELASELKRSSSSPPLWVKISPDLDERELMNLLEAIKKTERFRAVIACNTSVKEDWGKGGVSGRPLFFLARKVRKQALDCLFESNIDVLGVGGFESAPQIAEFLKDGGKAVQVYSALVFEGLGFVKHVLNKLMRPHSLS